MKKNLVIEKLYFDVIEKRESSSISDECKYFQKRAFKADEEMMKAFNGNGELEEKYRRVIDTLRDVYMQLEKEIFCEGFRRGFLLGLDIAEEETEN